MDYKGTELKLQTGDVVLFHTKTRWYKPMTWLSAAIRYFTKCKYNHAAIVVSNWHTLFISEAKAKGIVMSPAQKALVADEDKIIVLRPIIQLPEEDVATRANSALGKKYDFRNLIIVQLIYQTTGLWIGPGKKKEEESMVCSEYVAWCHQLEDWEKYSSKDFLDSTLFEVVYKEANL